MGVFEQVFAKRGGPEAADEVFAKRENAEAADEQSVGVFEEVFVRRGRWRNKGAAETQGEECILPQSESDVTHPEVLSEVGLLPNRMASDTNKPAVSDRIDEAQFVVKNTFINAGALEYDSLTEFLIERKIQSCPADCRVHIDEGTDDASTNASPSDDVMKTASNYGDIDTPLSLEQAFNTASNYGDADAPLLDTSSLKISLDEALNTASNYGDFDPHLMITEQQEMNAALLPLTLVDLHAQGLSQPSMASAVDDVMFQDTLTSLRMRGTAIHRTILRMKVSDIKKGIAEDACAERDVQQQWEVSMGDQQEFAAMDVGLDQLPSLPWYLPSCETMQPPPPPPLETAPLAAPVLRLAEAVPPPELGTPALPSIGSMLHYKRECKPCTFFHTRGCENKEDCQFCHLCGPGEKKKRLRQQRQQKREAKTVALENARAILASYCSDIVACSEECAESDIVIE